MSLKEEGEGDSDDFPYGAVRSIYSSSATKKKDIVPKIVCLMFPSTFVAWLLMHWQWVIHFYIL